MRATLRIKWLILLLGFLCHSVYANTTAETTAVTPANDASPAGPGGDKTTTITATTVSARTARATGANVTTSQNSIDKQSTAVQTTQITTVSTQNTPTVKATEKGTSPTATLTSPTNTAKETTAVITTSTLAATPTPAPSTAVATPSTGSVLSTKPSTVMTSPYPLSNKTTAPYNVSSQNKEQRESTNSTTVPTSKAPALATVPAGQPLSRVATEIPESTIVPGETRATTQLTNPGVSSTSSSTSSSSYSSTSSSVKKGVNTTTTDSAMQATTATIKTPTSTQKFVYSHKGKAEEKDGEKNLRRVCKRLMESMENGTCTLNWLVQNGSVKIESVEINGKVNESLAQQYYDELTQKEPIKTDNKTLIAILASCGALLIMIVILGACASHHRKPYNENQQHLTEELHTVENGYHDNPTLEVMEVQPEMLEKKMVLNGEFNDSWMVPLDHLSKEDHPEEEDTHL